jgi:hypothetical protein
MSLAAVIWRSIVALSLTLFLGACPETMLQQPPTECDQGGGMSMGYQLVPANGGQNVFAAEPPVVDPNANYAYVMSVTANSGPPGGPVVGIKTIRIGIMGISDCTGPQGTQRVVTPETQLYYVDYSPYGSTIGGLVQSFNYSQIACPAGTVATAGTLFFNNYIATYCEQLWVGHFCEDRAIAGRRVDVTDTRCPNLPPPFDNIAAAH